MPGVAVKARTASATAVQPSLQRCNSNHAARARARARARGEHDSWALPSQVTRLGLDPVLSVSGLWAVPVPVPTTSWLVAGRGRQQAALRQAYGCRGSTVGAAWFGNSCAAPAATSRFCTSVSAYRRVAPICCGRAKPHLDVP